MESALNKVKEATERAVSKVGQKINATMGAAEDMAGKADSSTFEDGENTTDESAPSQEPAQADDTVKRRMTSSDALRMPAVITAVKQRKIMLNTEDDTDCCGLNLRRNNQYLQGRSFGQTPRILSNDINYYPAAILLKSDRITKRVFPM